MSDDKPVTPDKAPTKDAPDTAPPTDSALSDQAPSATDKASAPRRRSSSWRWRVILIVVVLLLLLALLLWWRGCLPGRGRGDQGSRNDGQQASMSMSTGMAAGARCQLRVDAKGVSHDGRSVEIPAAVKACRGTKQAELTVTGDATYGTVDRLEKALRAAGVTVFRK